MNSTIGAKPRAGAHVRIMAILVALLLLVTVAVPPLLAGTTSRPGHGLLSVGTDPTVPSAITVDGIVRNTSSVVGLELPVGEHEISFSSVPGYIAPVPKIIEIREGESTEITGRFLPAGTLSVEVAPNGLDPVISVDGIARDRAPITLQVATGDREICVDTPTGYLPAPCQAVTVRQLEMTSATFNFQPVTDPDVELQPEPDPDPAVGDRVSEGLAALYGFSEGAGETISDVAGVVDGADLHVADASAVTWTKAGLRFDAPTIASTINAPTALYDRILASEEFTIEAWVTPANTTQDGPARIVTMARDTNAQNFVLGQGEHEGADGTFVEVRLHERTGDWQMRSPRGSIAAQPVHLAAVRSTDGNVKLYIDGQLSTEQQMASDLDGWDTSYPLGIGQEHDGQRPFLGTYHLLAIYDTALSAQDIATNLQAGPGVDIDPSDTFVEPEPESEPETNDKEAMDPEPAPEPPSSWQAAWDSTDYATLQAWFRANTGIAAAGLTGNDLAPSGSVTSTHDGQVIEGLLISGNINVRHNDVIIRNTKIIGSSIGIDVPYNARNNVQRFHVKNVSLIGTEPTDDGAARRGISGTYATVHATSVYISNRGAGIRLSSSGGDTVNLSMIENIRTHPGSHNTGISYRGGDGVRLTRNWIEGSTSSALSLYPDAAPITDHLSRENLFDGGTYSIRGGTGKQYASELRDIKFIDNQFTRNYQYGVRAAWCGSCPGNEWTGNKFLNDGAPAS